MSEAEFRSLRSDEAEQVVSLVATVFNGCTDHYRSLLHGDPLLDFDHIQVAVVDDSIVNPLTSLSGTSTLSSPILQPPSFKEHLLGICVEIARLIRRALFRWPIAALALR